MTLLTFTFIIGLVNCSDYYYATYDFRDDVVGGNPSDFIIDESGGTINIIAEKDNHKKVLEFYDNSSTNFIFAKNEFDVQINSIIEFWWSYNGSYTTLHYLEFKLIEITLTKIRIYFNYGEVGTIQSRTGDMVFHTIISGLLINIMYHIKIVYNDNTNTFDFYVNEVNKGSFNYFANSTIGIDCIYFQTRPDSLTTYYHWIDAIGYSWDFNYNIGDNKFPELNMTDILIPIFSLLFLIFLMILMIFIYMKVRIWLVILVLFLFSLIIGIYSLSLEYIPFNPYFSIFFILFQSILFIKRSLEVYRL